MPTSSHGRRHRPGKITTTTKTPCRGLVLTGALTKEASSSDKRASAFLNTARGRRVPPASAARGGDARANERQPERRWILCERPGVSERQAFTLVEIMIIVALIGLLAALAVPTFIKARKQSQGKRIVNDARIIDAAVDAWAFEKGKRDGDPIDAADLAVIGSTPRRGRSVRRMFWAILTRSGPSVLDQVLVSPEIQDALAGRGN